MCIRDRIRGYPTVILMIGEDDNKKVDLSVEHTVGETEEAAKNFILNVKNGYKTMKSNGKSEFVSVNTQQGGRCYGNNNLDENVVDLDLNLAEFSVNNLASKSLSEKRELYVKIVTLINKYIVKVKSLDKLRVSLLEAVQYNIGNDDLAHDTLEFSDDEDEEDVVDEPVVEATPAKKTASKKTSKKEAPDADLAPVAVVETPVKKARGKKATSTETVEQTVVAPTQVQVTAPVVVEEPVKKARGKKAAATEPVVTAPVVTAPVVVEEPVKKSRGKKAATTETQVVVETPVVVAPVVVAPVVVEEPVKKSRGKKAAVTEPVVVAPQVQVVPSADFQSQVSVTTETKPKSGKKKTTA